MSVEAAVILIILICGPILGLIIWMVWLIIAPASALPKKKNDNSNYFVFVPDTRGANRLLIKQRGTNIIKAIKINESRNYTYKNVPDKLIYTGATVGGISTGGLHVQKGGIAITGSKKNGKFYLSYALIPSYQYQDGSLTFIELTDSDFEDFKKSRINHLITSEENKKWYNLDRKNLIDARNLSKDAAYALKDWLAKLDTESIESLKSEKEKENLS